MSVLLLVCFFSYSCPVRRGGWYTYSYSIRPTVGIAAVQTAIEYEYRFAEYEYEYDQIRCEARTSYWDARETLRCG
ncbi:MAG: hypothetical protein ACOYKN_03625 [Pirellula sp.]